MEVAVLCIWPMAAVMRHCLVSMNVRMDRLGVSLITVVMIGIIVIMFVGVGNGGMLMRVSVSFANY